MQRKSEELDTLTRLAFFQYNRAIKWENQGGAEIRARKKNQHQNKN